MTTLFRTGNFNLHSGGKSDFKIDCDALSDESIRNLAKLIAKEVSFSHVYGVPTGGLRLARELTRHTLDGYGRLIVDDVLTTGNSMEEARRTLGWDDATGVVVFCRHPSPPKWIRPIFQMWQ